MSKVNFVMTDSIAYNLQVIETLCKKLGTDAVETLKTLLWNVYSFTMFKNKLKKVFHQIYNCIGINTIKECFSWILTSKKELFCLEINLLSK